MATQVLTSEHRKMQQSERLQERFRVTRTETASRHAEADGINGTIPKPLWPSRRVMLPQL